MKGTIEQVIEDARGSKEDEEQPADREGEEAAGREESEG
jgi:hypothetical protein